MMKRSQPIIFLGQREADHVMIEPIQKVSNGWRTANILVRCGVWTGHYSGQFLVGELAKFGKDMQYFCENLGPTAALNSVEHYLQLNLADLGHGRVRVQGSARERVGDKTSLEFEFEIDRKTLPEVAQSLIDADHPE